MFRMGMKISAETIAKRTQTRKNKGWYKDDDSKKRHEEQIRKVGFANKDAKVWNKGKSWSVEAKKKMSKAKKGKTYKEIGREPLSEKSIEQIRKKIKDRWNTIEHARKCLCFASPNYLEKKLDGILRDILPNEYKYVGDGQFILDRKCPDFLNINGKKKLIELFGEHWHKKGTENERIEYFKKRGYETLVIWAKDLQTETSKQRILNFNNV